MYVGSLFALLLTKEVKGDGLYRAAEPVVVVMKPSVTVSCRKLLSRSSTVPLYSKWYNI